MTPQLRVATWFAQNNTVTWYKILVHFIMWLVKWMQKLLGFREKQAHKHLGFRHCFLPAYQSHYSQIYLCLSLLTKINKHPESVGKQQPGAMGSPPPPAHLFKQSKPPWEYAKFHGLEFFLFSPTCHLIVCTSGLQNIPKCLFPDPERLSWALPGRLHILFLLSYILRVCSAQMKGTIHFSFHVTLQVLWAHVMERKVRKDELKCFQSPQIWTLSIFLGEEQRQCQSTDLPDSRVTMFAVSLQNSDVSVRDSGILFIQ